MPDINVKNKYIKKMSLNQELTTRLNDFSILRFALDSSKVKFREEFFLCLFFTAEWDSDTKSETKASRM